MNPNAHLRREWGTPDVDAERECELRVLSLEAVLDAIKSGDWTPDPELLAAVWALVDATDTWIWFAHLEAEWAA